MADFLSTFHKLLDLDELPEGRVTTVNIGHHSFRWPSGNSNRILPYRSRITRSALVTRTQARRRGPTALWQWLALRLRFHSMREPSPSFVE